MVVIRGHYRRRERGRVRVTVSQPLTAGQSAFRYHQISHRLSHLLVDRHFEQRYILLCLPPFAPKARID